MSAFDPLVILATLDNAERLADALEDLDARHQHSDRRPS